MIQDCVRLHSIGSQRGSSSVKAASKKKRISRPLRYRTPSPTDRFRRLSDQKMLEVTSVHTARIPSHTSLYEITPNVICALRLRIFCIKREIWECSNEVMSLSSSLRSNSGKNFQFQRLERVNSARTGFK